MGGSYCHLKGFLQLSKDMQVMGTGDFQLLRGVLEFNLSNIHVLITRLSLIHCSAVLLLHILGLYPAVPNIQLLYLYFIFCMYISICHVLVVPFSYP